MEVNKILSADILDILFDGKNKAYGAYDLRKSYNRRMYKSLLITGSVLTLLLLGYFLSNLQAGSSKVAMNIKDIDLASVETEKKIEPPVIIPPKIDPPKVEMKQFTPPKIVKDDQVKADEKPPEQDKLDDTKIGTINQEGVKDEGITAPPVTDGNRGVVEAPKEEDYDKTFIKVEVESSYPGGVGAWSRFLHKELRYPEEAQNNEIQGPVVVQFIVDKEGNVSEVKAISGPEKGGLREEAVRVIKKSGKWTAAIQNGHTVKSYKNQPIGFSMVTE
ncbi:energy transducer TonB [Flavitalea flava]